jgi:hypothetical protein
MTKTFNICFESGAAMPKNQVASKVAATFVAYGGQSQMWHVSFSEMRLTLSIWMNETLR